MEAVFNHRDLKKNTEAFTGQFKVLCHLVMCGNFQINILSNRELFLISRLECCPSRELWLMTTEVRDCKRFFFFVKFSNKCTLTLICC